MKKTFIFILAFVFFCQTSLVYGEETQIDFQVAAQLSENQISKENTYFDLQVEPGETQKISVTLENTSEQKKTFLVEANDATTSDGLTIAYSRTQKPLIGTPTFSQIVDEEQQQRVIEADPQETKTISFDLTYPETNIPGYILGGIYIYEQTSDTSKESNINFYNQFAYAIAVKLQTNDEVLTPSLELGDITLDSENNHPVVKAELSNPVETMISDLTIESSISKNGEVIETHQFQNGKVAPISMFHLTMPLENGSLEPGTYLFSGEANSGEHHWEWSQEFEVTDDNYQKVEEEMSKKLPRKTG